MAEQALTLFSLIEWYTGQKGKEYVNQDNTWCVIEEENQSTWHKNLSTIFLARNYPLVNLL